MITIISVIIYLIGLSVFVSSSVLFAKALFIDSFGVSRIFYLSMTKAFVVMILGLMLMLTGADLSQGHNSKIGMFITRDQDR